MKIRNGFVSNSSSSSFVLVGFTVPHGTFTDQDYLKKLYSYTNVPEGELDEALEDAFYDLMDGNNVDNRNDGKISVCTDTECGAPRGVHLIGVRVADVSSEDGGFVPTSFDFYALATVAERARKRLGVSAEDAPIRLFVGTRLC